SKSASNNYMPLFVRGCLVVFKLYVTLTSEILKMGVDPQMKSEDSRDIDRSDKRRKGKGDIVL
ncbi:MAG TPA: hypothetical protein PLY87_31260, partial [Planctomycetaceae bacterium]|nr:hypothetical protein [Planctomycetaceae bacterium]